MKINIVYILFFVLVSKDFPAQKNVNCNFPFGMWTITPYDSVKMKGTIVSVNLTDTFYYHRDTSITLRLYFITRSTNPKTVLPADNLYRLKARWIGNDISVLFGNGKWEKMFYWNVDHFEYANDPGTIYNFLPCEKLKTLKSGILKKRKLN